MSSDLPKLAHESWESYDAKKEEEFVSRVEDLGFAIMEGRNVHHRDVLFKFKKQWKCATVQEVRDVLYSDRAQPYFKKMAKMRALHASLEALPSQAELAKTDVQAALYCAKVADLVGTGGVTVNANTMIDQRNMGDNESDRGFFLRMQDRLLEQAKRRLELVEGEAVDEAG